MHRSGVLLVAFVALFASGCATPDIAVINGATRDIHSPPFGSGRQALVGVDPASGRFRTMVREKTTFCVRTFDRDCRIVDERRLPAFTAGYCGATHFAFSPDGARVAYLRDGSEDLFLYDLDAERESLVGRRIARNAVEVFHLQWITEQQLLIALYPMMPQSTTESEIAVINVETREKTTLCRPTQAERFTFALSGTTLAFVDAERRHSLHGRIKLLDVRTGAMRGEIGSGQTMIRNLSWSPDGSELAYVEDRVLKVWTAADGRIRELRRFPERTVCYHVVHGHDRMAIVAADFDRRGAVKPMAILDAQTGAELQSVTAEYNGRIFLLDCTPTFVCEVGI